MNIFRPNKKLSDKEYIERIMTWQKRLTVLFAIFAILYVIVPLLFPENDFLKAYTTSLFTVFAIVDIIFQLRINKILNDPERLKQMKIQTEDERSMLIKEKAAKTSFWLSIMILVMIGVIFAFFNPYITILAVGTAFAMNLIFFLVRTILERKY